jgi:hypothetical protein
MGFFELYRKLSVRLFGGLARKSGSSFSSLKPHIMGAGMNVLLESWIAVIYLTTVIAYFASLAAVLAVSSFILFDFMTFVFMSVFAPVMTSSVVFVILYLYPIQKSSSMRNSIDNSLPFALAHMSAIASSGIPPEFMFELLTGFGEYGEVSRQAGLIVRNIKTFGMSSVNAIADVANRTPSPAFRQVLMGMHSTIEKGGNLSTYADFYAAVLITAPIMMIVVLGVMSIIGGDIMGFAANDLIFLMTWVMVPLMNIAFIAFLHFSYPSS